MRFPSRGLYAITQTDNPSETAIINAVIAALKGGAAVIQYRDKTRKNPEPLAIELLNICHEYQVPLIINDDLDLAERIGADGVHLGRDDSDIISARQRLGKTAIIGISCYNSVERAKEAELMGATYVAFGRFFPSGSKPLAAPADMATLQEAKTRIQVPIVAIGGILPENGTMLLQAGADLLAVIGGVFNANPEQSAIKYRSLFSNLEL